MPRKASAAPALRTLALSLLLFAGGANEPVKLAVLDDMCGPYADVFSSRS